MCLFADVASLAHAWTAQEVFERRFPNRNVSDVLLTDFRNEYTISSALYRRWEFMVFHRVGLVAGRCRFRRRFCVRPVSTCVGWTRWHVTCLPSSSCVATKTASSPSTPDRRRLLQSTLLLGSPLKTARTCLCQLTTWLPAHFTCLFEVFRHRCHLLSSS